MNIFATPQEGRKFNQAQIEADDPQGWSDDGF